MADEDEVGQPTPRLEPDAAQSYRVDKRSACDAVLHCACRVTGEPGDQFAPFRTIMPTPLLPSELETPLEAEVSCRSTQVPLASVMSKPASGGAAAKQVEVMLARARWFVPPSAALGQSRVEGELFVTLEVEKGARSHRS